MKFYSTNNHSELFSFETAVMNGLAEDGGLYMPTEISTLEKDFIRDIEKYSFAEIAFHIAEKFIGNDIEPKILRSIINDAINFPAPLVPLRSPEYSVLELFHGTTLAFKDFGARFMARTMGHFVAGSNKELNILVATSGDTGSAVAYGFYDTPGINVSILYPKGKVSGIQEKQLTTLDKNITAIEIDGTFDDCQRLVKAAMTDIDLKEKNLSSANSINIARLIPQIFYYFEMYRQIPDKKKNNYISVPSGNLGNLTAGLIAKRMGLPITKFISSLNSNSVFAEYISSGEFIPRASIQTISNAMDVGNPSNLVRIAELYDNDINAIRSDIYSESFSDAKTKEAIAEIYKNNNYVIDPHGAVGYLGLRSFIEANEIKNYTGIILETAHPAKFKDVVEEAIGEEVTIPKRLAECLLKEKKAISLSSNYPDLKEHLLSK
ncbi:threonine synthase [bacterium BRH_c32]|nr:MAG: threonine synthase [bacterium BRH_c32]